MSVFPTSSVNVLKEPMFFGEPVNVSRYDQQKHPIFEKLIEKQLAFFWTPEEVDLARDSKDFRSLSEHEKHIFLSNLKYQILLDSIQGRSPNRAFLPVVSIPELESWIEVWSFSEVIHSRSYTHIIRNIVNDPSIVFESIVTTPEIVERAKSVSKYYDDVIEKTAVLEVWDDSDPKAKADYIYATKKALYLALAAVNVLEAIRFYVSFACSFSFAERALMEGNAKIIKLIARDEALHLTGTQHMLNLIQGGKDDDPDMFFIAQDSVEEVRQIFIDAADQEKEWAKYLFKDGSMIGLNEHILCQYIEYITNIRMQAIGLAPAFGTKSNPIPWINAWLVSDNVQVAPQEAEISSYLVGNTDNALDDDEFSGMTL